MRTSEPVYRGHYTTTEDMIRSRLTPRKSHRRFVIASKCNQSFRMPWEYDQIDFCCKEFSLELTQKVAEELGLWEGYLKYKTEQKIKKMEEKKGIRYFVRIGQKEREVVRSWISSQGYFGRAQKIFLKRVKEALLFIDYDYEIASLEPSMDNNGNLYYKMKKTICEGLTFREWQEKAKAFYPERGSDLATVYELFLWYAYRIATKQWSLNFVCNNSSKGNYKDSPGTTNSLELSGERTIGGACDGVGNTTKIVSDTLYFGICGGDYNVFGRKVPVAKFLREYDKNVKFANSVGVLVLRD